ncbi:phosphoribosyltransferase [Streptomyces fenghuangensis]
MAADPRVGAVLSWGDVEALTGSIAERVWADGAPEAVVGVLRGGMVPATLLAHRLGVRDMRAVEVTRTTADGVGAAKAPEPQYRNPASLGVLTGLDVLVVDDIAGSGATLDRARRLVRALGPSRIRTAAMAVNRDNWSTEPGPEEAIDYIGELYEGWVVFPWERH